MTTANTVRPNDALFDSVTLIFAQPCQQDAEDVMTLRNDPVTLRMSYHQEAKQMPGFLDEFVNNYFPSDAPPPMFATLQGQRVGFVRFRNYAEDLAPALLPALDISVMVHACWRGRGVGRRIVQQATALAHAWGWGCVVAEIRPGNAISVRLFSGSGYRHSGVHRRVIHDLPAPVWVLRYFHTEAKV